MQHQALESCIWKLECELKGSADSAPLLWNGSKYSTTGSGNTGSYKCAGSENYTGAHNALGLSSAGSLSWYEDSSANRLVRH